MILFLVANKFFFFFFYSYSVLFFGAALEFLSWLPDYSLFCYPKDRVGDTRLVSNFCCIMRKSFYVN